MAIAHRPLDRFGEMRRGDEAELNGVANIQVTDARPCGLYLLRLYDDIPDGVSEPIKPPGGTNGRSQDRHRENVTSGQ
jgi:hypothetical protein